MPTSTAIAGGALLATNDGGHTWSLMPHDPGISGEVSFLTVNIGCVVVGPGQEHIFSTENGGKTWQEVTPKIPPEFGAIVTYVCFPVAFQNSREVLLPVVYTTENRPTYVLFSTKDGGRIWSRRIAIPIKSGNWLEYAVVGRGVVTADLSDLTLTLTLTRVAPGGERGTARARVPTVSSSSSMRDVCQPALYRLILPDADHGWVLTSCPVSRGLLATQDGGRSWKEVTPKSQTKPNPKIEGTKR